MRDTGLLIAIVVFAGVLGGLAGGAVPQRGPNAAGAVDGGEVWGESYFPKVPLVTHRDRQVRFFDLIAGKVVAIDFLDTPSFDTLDTCPAQTERLLEVVPLLGDRLGEDVFFYTLTPDPEQDPRTLAELAERCRIPAGWTFLAGEAQDLALLRRKLGMDTEDVASLLIGNQRTGRWMRRSPFEDPHLLADQLGTWLHGWDREEPRFDAADGAEPGAVLDGG